MLASRKDNSSSPSLGPRYCLPLPQWHIPGGQEQLPLPHIGHTFSEVPAEAAITVVTLARRLVSLTEAHAAR